jgi:membrane protease YdiL (CAAX protease family)
MASVLFSLSSVAIVLVYTWWIAPIAPREASFVPVVLVLGLVIWHAITRGEWGFRPAAFLPALGWSAAFTAIGAVTLGLAGIRLGTLGRGADAAHLSQRLIMLMPWALGQQFALQTMLLRESQGTVSKPGGIVVAALLFGILHLPNPFLTTVTTIAGLAWCWIYDRHPNLAPLALSHALLTLAILYALSDTVSLRVGARFAQ